MKARKMWFGNTTHAQWVPCPATGLRRTRQGWSEELTFENGGAWLEESAAWHTVYEMEFPVADSSEYEGIEAFERFAARQYGDDYLRFVDPMQADRNLLSPVWANPSLIEQGWKNPVGVPTSFTDNSSIAINQYKFPPRVTQFHLEDAPISTSEFVGKPFTLLIPPNYALIFAGSLHSTDAAELSLQIPDGSFFDFVSETSGTVRVLFALPGTFVPFVRLGIRRTGVGDFPAVSISGLVAQIVPESQVPTLPLGLPRWIPGEGHSGLRFRGKALPETYVMKDRHLSGMSAELIEVEPWED